jgi:hypothetical protein
MPHLSDHFLQAAFSKNRDCCRFFPSFKIGNFWLTCASFSIKPVLKVVMGLPLHVSCSGNLLFGSHTERRTSWMSLFVVFLITAECWDDINSLKPKREWRRESGWVVLHTTFNGRGGKAKFMAMKVPRQCPLVLLVKVGWRGGKKKV